MARLPFFPIVPSNAPSDDLYDYLRLYSREAVGMLDGRGASHAEWDVNLPIPKMRALEGFFGLGGSSLGVVGGVLGADPGAIVDSAGNVLVSATWAQRAMNAVLLPLTVDDNAGPLTLAALTTYWNRIGGASTGIAPSIFTRNTVKMSPGMASRLAQQTQVADPVRPAPATGGGGGSDPLPEADPPALDLPSGGASGGVVLAVAVGIGLAMWFGRRR